MEAKIILMKAQKVLNFPNKVFGNWFPDTFTSKVPSIVSLKQ